MSVYQEDMRTEILQRLGDSSALIWTQVEIDKHIQDGYDQLTERTGCLWATDVLPDYAAAFSYTSKFELDYFLAEFMLSGIGNFTAEFERDYINNAQGPANHTQHWEFNDGHVETTLCRAVEDLPEDLHDLERATWNTKRIEPLRSRELEESDSRYELNTGQVQAYVRDKDGLDKIRKWLVPSAAYEPYDMDSDSTSFGVLIQITDVTSDTPEGQWGDLVQVPGEHLMGDPWGVIVGIYTEPNNMRMEYRRRGFPLSVNQPFEIPDRYTVYVRHYAMARALEREGDGQDLELAAHYQSRYEVGIARMLRRQKAMQYQRKYVMGGGSNIRTRTPLARLPWNYGQVVR